MPHPRIILCTVLCCVAAHGGLAQDTTTTRDSAGPPRVPLPARVVDSLHAASGEPHTWLTAGEVLGVLTINSIASRILFPNDMEDGKKVYSATFQSTWNHLTVQRWVYDIDPFNTNQFQHPYQGASMYQMARATGHGFWTSLIYSNIGEFVWKMAGETDPPSINDMITTGQAGSMFGEALYRMADLIVRDGDATGMNLTHAIGIWLVSPATGLNRQILGNRYRAHLPDSLPANFWQLKFGFAIDPLTNIVSSIAPPAPQPNGTVDFQIAYGLPGRAGYTYTRPFDYFDFQGTVVPSSFSNFIENIMVRGLLAGEKTADTDNQRGIWGLYGTYDYISPRLFRVSSTALSLGTTRQYLMGGNVSLQGTFLAGAGFGAAGTTTVIPSTPTAAAIRDYHFGLTPQGMLALRLIVGEAAMLDMTSRYYYVSGAGSDDSRGLERIFRGNVGFTFRVYGGNAVGLQYVLSTRSAQYGTLPTQDMKEGTITLVYTIMGNRHFGSTSWR